MSDLNNNIINTDYKNEINIKSNTNFQKILDNTINKVVSDGKVPSLLIHSCCAPCSSYTLEYLSQYFKITVLYYNPNIFPEEEYDYRISEQKRLIEAMNFKYPVEFIATDYTPMDFHDNIKGFEKEPEGGKRCELCFGIRLEKAAKMAKEMGFDYFVTTLSISPMKDSYLLNTIGDRIAKKYGIAYLYSDFKKRNGYKRSVELSKEYNLYRQDYCGCIYSKIEREEKSGCK
ncbi:MAG: epoxyqueuosine reductase QueH [Lachnospiraceae bacterium]|nr:epoxyqueuosine reductase QueH [Lachnospiraceae bacterium]